MHTIMLPSWSYIECRCWLSGEPLGVRSTLLASCLDFNWKTFDYIKSRLLPLRIEYFTIRKVNEEVLKLSHIANNECKVCSCETYRRLFPDRLALIFVDWKCNQWGQSCSNKFWKGSPFLRCHDNVYTPILQKMSSVEEQLLALLWQRGVFHICYHIVEYD